VKDVLNNYIPIDLRPDLKSKIFEATYSRLKASASSNDKGNRIILLKDQLTVFASASNDQVDRL
jgi:hypothetical protein